MYRMLITSYEERQKVHVLYIVEFGGAVNGV